MEQAPAPPKQRSPWFYVVLGCGGFAALSCLVMSILFGYVWKKGSDVMQGVNDPKVREENTRKMLGGLPPDYRVIAGVNVFVMQASVLVKGTFFDDGGIDDIDRTFTYFKFIANENNAPTKEYFKSDSADSDVLRKSGINVSVDKRDVVKRGNFTISGRKLYYVVARGKLDMRADRRGGESQLHDLVLFDCPGDELRVGVWSMTDPDPTKAAPELDVTDTVGDETKMVPFFKTINPCEG